VLGSIYVIETAENESRVPYLWKLPILGQAFKNRGVRDRRKELLIFVQPSVVVSPQRGPGAASGIVSRGASPPFV
jgi:type II secretory pathway component HofQ